MPKIPNWAANTLAAMVIILVAALLTVAFTNFVKGTDAAGTVSPTDTTVQRYHGILPEMTCSDDRVNRNQCVITFTDTEEVFGTYLQEDRVAGGFYIVVDKPRPVKGGE